MGANFFIKEVIEGSLIKLFLKATFRKSKNNFT